MKDEGGRMKDEVGILAGWENCIAADEHQSVNGTVTHCVGEYV